MFIAVVRINSEEILKVRWVKQYCLYIKFSIALNSFYQDLIILFIVDSTFSYNTEQFIYDVCGICLNTFLKNTYEIDVEIRHQKYHPQSLSLSWYRQITSSAS